MLRFRKAKQEDMTLLFSWANDPLARKNSYNQQQITKEEHISWFEKQLRNADNEIYIFLDENQLAVGQVRFGLNVYGQAIISLFIVEEHRGKGYANQMIDMATTNYLEAHKTGTEVLAYIFKANETSLRSFLKAGFKLTKEEDFSGIPSYILKRNK